MKGVRDFTRADSQSMVTKNQGEGVVSVVIRARNAESDLRHLLPCLRSQRVPDEVELQLVVVDNDSTDATVLVATEFGCEVLHLPAVQFSWGRALNRGIDSARGELVVLLSADAYPDGPEWLSKICKPFSDERLAASYGRQVPKDSAPLDEWARVKATFPSSDRLWSAESISDGGVRGLIASNACAAIRRSVWAIHRFDEDCHGAEEIPWVSSVLKAGYNVRYVCDAKVYHSHRERAMKQAMRLWELELESRRLDGRPVRVSDAFRWIGGFAKGRAQNMFLRGSGICRRLEALCFLPIEMLAIAFVSLSTASGIDFQTIRKRW